MIDRVSTSNFRTKLIVSPSKDMVVHHNWLKLCYGTPQEVTAPSGQSPATRCLYSDVVCWIQQAGTPALLVILCLTQLLLLNYLEAVDHLHILMTIYTMINL